MEEILFWVCYCHECNRELIIGDNDLEEKEIDEDFYIACPACGKAFDTSSTPFLTIAISRSKLNKLDRPTLIKVKEKINWLIERKTAEAKED